MGRWGCLRRLLRGGVSRAEERDESWHTQEMVGERRDRAPSVHYWEPENRRLPSMLHSVMGSITRPGDHNMDMGPSEQSLTGRWLPFDLIILAFIITPCPLDYYSQIFFFLSWHAILSLLFSSRNFLFLFCFLTMRHVRSYFPNQGARVRTLQ